MDDEMKDKWNKMIKATTPKDITRPRKRRVVKKVVPKVAPKCERHFSREVRYFIFQKTGEGRLIHPTESDGYSASETIFDDYSGYATLQEAHQAIEKHLEKEDDMGFEKNFYRGEKKCCERSEEYLVITQLIARTWWEKVETE